MKSIISDGLKGGLGELKDVTKKSEGIINEFKEFISRGNVIDLAVGVIIGGAFGKIVSSLVSDILMPLIGTVMGGLRFEGLSVTVGDATIAYGLFIQNIIDFLIIAASIFIFVKIINKFNRRAEKKPEVVVDKKLENIDNEQLEVLKEIRSELKKSNRKDR